MKTIAISQQSGPNNKIVWDPTRRTRIGAHLPRRWPAVSLFLVEWSYSDMRADEIVDNLWALLASDYFAYQLLNEAERLPDPTPSNSAKLLKALKAIGGDDLGWSADTARKFVEDARELAGIVVGEIEGR